MESGPRHPLAPRLLRSALAMLVAFICGVAVADQEEPRAHPAEAGLRLFLDPLAYRHVVRNDDGGYDIWLHGEAPWAKVRGRIEQATRVGFEMPGGWWIEKAVWLDADRSYWLDLDGPGELKVRASRDGKGTLFELKYAGLRQDAPPWAPPYAPLPPNMVHGPIR